VGFDSVHDRESLFAAQVVDASARLGTPPVGLLPGRGRWRAFVLGLVALWALALVSISAAGPIWWRTAGPALGGLALLTCLAWWPTCRWRMARLTVAPGRELTAHHLAAALETSGVTSFRLWLRFRGRPGRSFRVGRRAAIEVNAAAPHGGLAFLLAHEAGHCARYDALRAVLLNAVLYSLWVTSLGVVPAAGDAPTLVAAVFLVAGYNWWRELACDRLAAGWAGADSAAACMEWFARIQPGQARSPRAWARQGRRYLTHPPLALRCRVAQGRAPDGGNIAAR